MPGAATNSMSGVIRAVSQIRKYIADNCSDLVAINVFAGIKYLIIWIDQF